MVVRLITQGYAEAKYNCNSINKSSMHASELCYRGLNQAKETCTRKYMVVCIMMIVTISWQVAVNLPITSITFQKGGKHK